MTSEMAGGAERDPLIRTPDQRVRVFVSSTLHELAAERAAARTAITRLHLTPVMFELGARPHAPRQLYRAYLADPPDTVAAASRKRRGSDGSRVIRNPWHASRKKEPACLSP